MIRIDDLKKQWKIPSDHFLQSVKNDWFSRQQKTSSRSQSVGVLNEWFQSTRLNDLVGWDTLSCIDISMGCTHYIESFIIGQQSLDNFQILTDEYAYYSFLGKWGVEPGNLEPNKPLIITLPHYKWGDIRPGWDQILRECERKKIDVHLDMTWLTLSKNISIDFAHPQIKSVGMSMSKYDLQWNRVGLRYSKQRRMDSITIFNHFYQDHNNQNLYSCAVFCADRIPRDYSWTTYADRNLYICESVEATQTKLIHGISKNNEVYCITDILCPHSKQTIS